MKVNKEKVIKMCVLIMNRHEKPQSPVTIPIIYLVTEKTRQPITWPVKLSITMKQFIEIKQQTVTAILSGAAERKGDVQAPIRRAGCVAKEGYNQC